MYNQFNQISKVQYKKPRVLARLLRKPRRMQQDKILILFGNVQVTNSRQNVILSSPWIFPINQTEQRSHQNNPDFGGSTGK